MKTVILVILLFPSLTIAQQDKWVYNLEVKYQKKDYTFNLLFDKDDALTIMKRNNLDNGYGLLDFLLSNQQHFSKGKIDWNNLAIDYSLNQSLKWLKPEYRSIGVQLLRFGIESQKWNFDSKTLSPGLRKLEFEIKF